MQAIWASISAHTGRTNLLIVWDANSQSIPRITPWPSVFLLALGSSGFIALRFASTTQCGCARASREHSPFARNQNSSEAPDCSCHTRSVYCDTASNRSDITCGVANVPPMLGRQSSDMLVTRRGAPTGGHHVTVMSDAISGIRTPMWDAGMPGLAAVVGIVPLTRAVLPRHRHLRRGLVGGAPPPAEAHTGVVPAGTEIPAGCPASGPAPGLPVVRSAAQASDLGGVLLPPPGTRAPPRNVSAA
jgi:hypothetical protein